MNGIRFLPKRSQNQFPRNTPRKKRLPRRRQRKLLEGSDNSVGRFLQSGDRGESDFSGGRSRKESFSYGRIFHFEIDFEEKSDGCGAALPSWKRSEAIGGARAHIVLKKILEHQ